MQGKNARQISFLSQTIIIYQCVIVWHSSCDTPCILIMEEFIMKTGKLDEQVEKLIKSTAYAFFSMYSIGCACLVYAFLAIRLEI